MDHDSQNSQRSTEAVMAKISVTLDELARGQTNVDIGYALTCEPHTRDDIVKARSLARTVVQNLQAISKTADLDRSKTISTSHPETEAVAILFEVVWTVKCLNHPACNDVFSIKDLLQRYLARTHVVCIKPRAKVHINHMRCAQHSCQHCSYRTADPSIEETTGGCCTRNVTHACDTTLGVSIVLGRRLDIYFPLRCGKSCVFETVSTAPVLYS